MRSNVFQVGELFTVLQHNPVHTSFCMPVNRRPLNQSDRRILFVLQSVYNETFKQSHKAIEKR